MFYQGEHRIQAYRAYFSQIRTSRQTDAVILDIKDFISYVYFLGKIRENNLNALLKGAIDESALLKAERMLSMKTPY
ncbi:MAG: hypothetical protein B5M54_10535 [Candidatus Aminicenantes bacterium 4484_214]|nr:MAG: hypothetical protein B5M54_10535 [Candidatus Aminicenantes bacterium 4484_214]